MVQILEKNLNFRLNFSLAVQYSTVFFRLVDCLQTIITVDVRSKDTQNLYQKPHFIQMNCIGFLSSFVLYVFSLPFEPSFHATDWLKGKAYFLLISFLDFLEKKHCGLSKKNFKHVVQQKYQIPYTSIRIHRNFSQGYWKIKREHKYSPRYRGSKFQNFKSPIRGYVFGGILQYILQLNKQCCGAILSSVKICDCQSNSNTRRE